jgi:hypothetical protein
MLAADCPAMRPRKDTARAHLPFAERSTPLQPGVTRSIHLPLFCQEGSPERIRLTAVYYSNGIIEGDPALLAEYLAARRTEAAVLQTWLPRFQALRRHPNFGAAADSLSEDLHWAVVKANRVEKEPLRSLADAAARLADSPLSAWQLSLVKLEQRWTRLQPFLPAVPAPAP